MMRMILIVIAAVLAIGMFLSALGMH